MRRLGKLILGKATPFQLLAAAVLGGMLGLVPVGSGAGMAVLLLLVLLILNANLLLASLVTILAKLLSPILMPACFQAGRVLLEGPTQPLFKTLINAPGSALLGLEHYAAAGSLVVGAALGVVAGWPVVAGVRAIRRRLAAAEEGSDRYQRLVGRWWVKAILFLVAGTFVGKGTYRKALERRVGLPIRPLGVALALLGIASAYVLVQYANGPLVSGAVRRGLERANGATVDIKSATVDLRAGRIEIVGLAMADPNDLSTDLLRAERATADVSGVDLLRKRMSLDRVVLSNASHGDPRQRPGVLVGRPPTPADDPRDVTLRVPDAAEIERYIKQAQEWKERLAELRRWLEKLAQRSEPETGEGEEDLSPWERAARRARESGYAHARADHLIEGAPTFLVRELLAEGVKARGLPEGETFELRGHSLSTHPDRIEERPRIEVRSSRGTIVIDAQLDQSSQGRIKFSYTGLRADALAGAWKLDPPPVKGGTIDLAADLALSPGGWLDFPLLVTLHDSTIAVPGAGSTAVRQFALPIRVRGRLDDPRITIDDGQLASALADAGAAELSRRLSGELEDKLKKEGIALPPEIQKGAGDLIGNLFGGKDKKKKDDAPP